MFYRICLLLALFVGLSLSASAATFYVNTTTDSVDAAPGNGVCANNASYCSLRAAITEANALSSNDTIVMPAGIFTNTLTGALEDNNATGDLDIYGNLTILGAGSGSTIFQAATSAGTATQRVMEIRPGAVVTINGVTIRYGVTGPAFPFFGGGILSSGTLSLNSCVVSNNEARINTSGTDNASGGGIYASGSLTLNGSTIMNNVVKRLGSTGGYTDGGAGIRASGTVNIFNSNIFNNQITSTVTSAAGYGAGLLLQGQFTAAINGSNFTSNTITTPGNIFGIGIAVYSNGSNSQLSMVSSTISQHNYTMGSSLNGGGLYLYSYGGALTTTIDRTTIGNNSASLGGGIYSTTNGGSTNLTMTNSTVSGNLSVTSGGGVYLTSFGTQPASTSTYNFINTTVSDNGSYQNGGGMSFVPTNSAASFQGTLNFSTVAGNIANLDNAGYEGGGGLYSTQFCFTLRNSVVGRNYAYGYSYAHDISGYFFSGYYNHIENWYGGSIAGGGYDTSGNPQIGSLGNYGGPTQTRHPYTGSPLIGQIPYGVNGCGTTVSLDQRGYSRPDVGYMYCDKGAVEVIGPN